MFSSQIEKKKDVLLAIYESDRTVFRLNDIALISGESNFTSLNQKLNYYVRTGKLQNLRKGIYAKSNYNKEEFACSVYSPSYISLEYVLQNAGIVFQYDPGITIISYLSRSIAIKNQVYQFRRMKENLLVNTLGIERKQNHVNIATAERAFLDMLYLEPNFYFDTIHSLNKKMIIKLLSVYHSNALAERVTEILKNG